LELRKTIIGRDREPKEELAGERVVGVGTGPTRQLDVVSEVGVDSFDLLTEPPSCESEWRTNCSKGATECDRIETQQSSLCTLKGGASCSKGTGESSSSSPSSSSCEVCIHRLISRDMGRHITTIAVTALDRDRNRLSVSFFRLELFVYEFLDHFGNEAIPHVPREQYQDETPSSPKTHSIAKREEQ